MTNPSFYRAAVLESFLARQPTRLSLKILLTFGRTMTEQKLLRSANYVREEFPVRLAHRIASFQQLPFVVGMNPHIHRVYEMYWEAFEMFRKVPVIKTLEENARLCVTLREKLQKHQLVVPLLSLGFRECIGEMPEDQIEHFLTRTLRSRLARRLIAQQHLRLSDTQPSKGGYVGVLAPSLAAVKMIDSASESSTIMCRRSYGAAPNVEIDGNTTATLAGVPEHIEFVLHDLIKNSMRAVVEKNGYVEIYDDTSDVADVYKVRPRLFVTVDALYEDPRTFTAQTAKAETQLPPVVVTIAESEKDVVFRVSDQGGGIPFEDLDKVWNFGYSTAPRRDHSVSSLVLAPDQVLVSAPMSGTGLGLLLARVHAEYLGGSIQLKSMEGYGTDAYYRVKRSPDDQLENVL